MYSLRINYQSEEEENVLNIIENSYVSINKYDINSVTIIHDNIVEINKVRQNILSTTKSSATQIKEEYEI